MSGSDDLLVRSAVDQARLVRAGDVSARELLAAHLDRIERINPALNAIVTLVPEMAADWASAADDRFAAGEEMGPLHGLPVAHKDLELTAGIRTTMGSPLFADHVPTEDSLIVERLRAAGAITIGKTNTPEFGAGSQTFNRVFGATRNPYDPSKTCGGSSGGAAVALATCMMPIADGSDTGGSLRNPASFCNVVGMRPSPGRVPSWPSVTPWAVLSSAGPMGRTVSDVALVMQALAGPDPRSPMSLSEPGSVFDTDLRTDVVGWRVAWSHDLGLPVDPAVRAALAPIPGVLDSLGCEVEAAAPDLTDVREIFQVLRAWGMEIRLGELYDRHGSELKDTVRWNIEEARRRSLPDHARASVAHAKLVERVRVFFERYDVLALPTTQVPPFDIDCEWVTEVDGVVMETYIDWMRSCSDITVMGCPALSVPAGFTPEGLPVGVQFVGRPRGDVDLLRFAYAFEQATRIGDVRPGDARPGDVPNP
ncbi:MAG TPA: amidase [Ilumatobacteraceae bacterium]|nr:amidase [Ilumatobacteraceae bacterium]